MTTDLPYIHREVEPFYFPVLFLLTLLQVMLVGSLFVTQPEEEPSFDGILTIAAPSLERTTSRITPYGKGFERELGDMLSSRTGITVQWIEVDDWQQAWTLFASGRADALVAPGYVPHEDQIEESMRAGPAYFEYPPLILHYKWSLSPNEPRNLCEAYLSITDNPALDAVLNARLEELVCPFVPPPVQEETRLIPLLENLEDNRYRFTLAEGGRFQVLEPFYPGLRKKPVPGRHIPHRWYWNTGDSRMDRILSEFWETIPDDPVFENLKERYFGFFPAKADYYDIEHFYSVLRNQLPQYVPFIKEAAQSYGIDPLLIVALIYQESRFDPAAKSWTGVRGLAQLTLPTAEEMEVKDRLDPKSSIMGGARYLRSMWERLDDLPLSPWDRWFVALSAYNQGMGHTRDAIRLALKLERNGNRWGELKTVYPLLSYRKYFSETQHGYCRGYEAVSFVESIRFYYYVLHGIVALPRPEAKHLAPLLEAVPAVWP
ncbi:MAG: transglycosylase SLT domain-containing protein [Desulfovibrionales bacterium]